jgi:hypothetical protein
MAQVRCLVLRQPSDLRCPSEESLCATNTDSGAHGAESGPSCFSIRKGLLPGNRHSFSEGYGSP